jgi:nitroreductase
MTTTLRSTGQSGHDQAGQDGAMSQASLAVQDKHAPDMRSIIELARRAPSVHNTQPWRWRIEGRAIELRADRSRQLMVSDPLGRNLTISCGCALHHAVVGAAALGWSARVDMLPERADPDLLARLHLASSDVPDDSQNVLRNIEDRRTDRRRFTNWPVPAERLHDLAVDASRGTAQVFALTDLTQRWRVEGLVERAIATQHQDERFGAEQRAWTDRGPTDGIPSTALAGGSERAPGLRTRFTPQLTQTTDRAIEGSDGLILIGTPSDGPQSWLCAGQALSALWLAATDGGLSVVPLSQVTELNATRLALRYDVMYGSTEPQIVARLGWQEIGRAELQPTPRRPLDDIIDA